MLDFNTDNLKAMIASPTDTMKTMQAVVKTNSQAIQCLDATWSPSTSTLSSGKTAMGKHRNDFPPRFQKTDFLKFDDKSNHLAFINRCESYLH